MADLAQSSESRRLRIGWFTTANGPGSRGMFEAVLHAIQLGCLDARFEFVFVSRERGQTAPTDSFLDLVVENGINAVTLSSLRFRRDHDNAPWPQLRDAYDRAVLSKLEGFNPDVSVMAGFMLFTPGISRRMLILNQHPALPGGTIGKWQEAIWDVIEQCSDQHGSMVHIATPELDRGPVATFCSFPIRGPKYDPLWADARNRNIVELRKSGDGTSPLFAAIREAGIKREQPLVVETLKAIANGEIDLNAIAESVQTEPIDMSDRVESAIAQIRP